MNSDARRYTRIYHKDLKYYKVVLEKLGRVLQGELGNISEGGFCAILPQNTELQVGEIVSGYLYYIRETNRYPFEGKIAWFSDYKHQGKIYDMIGLEFTSPIALPEHLLALAMSLE